MLGKGEYGAVGHGWESLVYSIPKNVLISSSDLGVKAIIATSAQTCAVMKDDNKVCWGKNIVGQIGGRISLLGRLDPLLIGDSGRGIKILTMKYYHTRAILINYNTHYWDLNNKGQLGNVSVTSQVSTSPITISLSSSGLHPKNIVVGD